MLMGDHAHALPWESTEELGAPPRGAMSTHSASIASYFQNNPRLVYKLDGISPYTWDLGANGGTLTH